MNYTHLEMYRERSGQTGAWPKGRAAGVGIIHMDDQMCLIKKYMCAKARGWGQL